VDRIRPDLRRAIKGLSNCYDDLALMAAQPWQRPKVKGERRATLAQVRQLLRDLTTHLSRLENEGLQHLQAGTGIGIGSLDLILGYVQGRPNYPSATASKGLADLVHQIRTERTKDELWALTDTIVDTIEQLHRAFG
jgi:hypothetical protein